MCIRSSYYHASHSQQKAFPFDTLSKFAVSMFVLKKNPAIIIVTAI